MCCLFQRICNPSIISIRISDLRNYISLSCWVATLLLSRFPSIGKPPNVGNGVNIGLGKGGEGSALKVFNNNIISAENKITGNKVNTGGH